MEERVGCARGMDGYAPFSTFSSEKNTFRPELAVMKVSGFPHPHLTLAPPGSKGGVYHSLLATCSTPPPTHPCHAFPERRVEAGWSLKEREG